MKFLIWVLLIAAAGAIWYRGRKIRELAEAEADSEDVETLVYDEKKGAYVPRQRRR